MSPLKKECKIVWRLRKDIMEVASYPIAISKISQNCRKNKFLRIAREKWGSKLRHPFKFHNKLPHFFSIQIKAKHASTNIKRIKNINPCEIKQKIF